MLLLALGVLALALALVLAPPPPLPPPPLESGALLGRRPGLLGLAWRAAAATAVGVAGVVGQAREPLHLIVREDVSYADALLGDQIVPVGGDLLEGADRHAAIVGADHGLRGGRKGKGDFGPHGSVPLGGGHPLDLGRPHQPLCVV